MGYIYIIKNSVNNKVYIGQTVRTIEQRFKQHLWRAATGTNKLYRAIRELGMDAFYIEKLRECEDKELNEYEQLFVEKYNSIEDGYNTVTPCTTIRGKKVYDFEDALLDLYENGWSIQRLTKEFKVSHKLINDIISNNSIERNYFNKGGHGIGKRSVVMYSKEFEPIGEFSSIRKAYEWLLENTEFSVTEFGAYSYIDVACSNGNIAYGHRWQDKKDLIFEDKLFRTSFDKRAYLTGANIKLDGRGFYIADGAFDGLKLTHEKHKCIDCGAVITYHATRCLSCSNKIKRGDLSEAAVKYKCMQCGRLNVTRENTVCNSCSNVIAKGKSPKPSKEELAQLIISGMSIKDIARQFGRTDSTVHYWLKQYGLR